MNEAAQCAACGPVDVLLDAMALCDGQFSCDIPMDDNLYDMSACPGVDKFVGEVGYVCIDLESKLCVNTDGGYACICPPGMSLFNYNSYAVLKFICQT